MKLILLGAPGAGKGTVAKLLTAVDGSVQISTGDILRGAVQAGTELGKKADAFMKAGDLVPDELIMGIMEDRLQEPDCAKGFLLDGFPRTIPQAEALKALLDRIGVKLDMAVNLDVPRDVILDRLILMPGNYFISTSISDQDGLHVFDEWNRSHKLNVQPGSSLERNGMFELGARWQPPVPVGNEL